MCKLAAKCKKPAAYIVVHKAVGAMEERRIEACETCAGRIGNMGRGRLIDAPGRESRFYKIEGF